VAANPPVKQASLLNLLPAGKLPRSVVIATAALCVGLFYCIITLRAGAMVPEWLPIFVRLFYFQDYVAAIAGILVLLASFSPPARRAGMAVAGMMARQPGVTALAALGGLVAGALLIYQNHPLAMDEYAPYLQSQVFAAGHLTGRLPPELVNWLVPEAFQGAFLKVNPQSGAVASVYLPGFATILTPFTALGVPWLCNPVIGALTLWVIWRIARELFADPLAAGFAVLFTVASAAVTVNAISYYSMAAHLLCNACFCLALLRPAPRRAFAAGVVGSLALTLHNPLPHLLFALPWAIWLLSRKDRVPLIASLVAGYLPFVLLGGLAWIVVTGKLFPAAATTPVPLLQGLYQTFTSVFILPNADVLVARAIGLAKLALWGVPIVCVLAIVGAWRGRRDLRLFLLGASGALTFIGFLFVPFDQGHGWGFRYFHSAWLVIPLLATAALFEKGANPAPAEGEGMNGLRSLSAACAVLTLFALTSLRLYQVQDFMTAHLKQLPSAKTGTAEVIIISPGMGYYADDLVQNDPFLRNRPLVMITRGKDADLAMMKQRFPELVLLHRDFRGVVWGRPSPSH
jgi:hypothetical protein